MKKSDYSNIKTIEQLRILRFENRCHVIRVEAKMKENLSSLRESLRLDNIFKEILGESLTYISRVGLYRQGFQLVRSLLRRMLS